MGLRHTKKQETESEQKLDKQLSSRNTMQPREEIEIIKNEFGFREPDRGNLDNPEIEWRYQKPDYTKADLVYFKGKTQNHSKGSLEEVVENLVKKWEMELSHKKDMSQWETVAPEGFLLQANDGEVFNSKTVWKIGNYNALMAACPAYQKYGLANDFERSHDLFRAVFTDAFPWEVLKVLSGPPNVIFTWRHWANCKGTFQGRKCNNELIEMYGLVRANVTNDLKMKKIEVFFDPERFLSQIEGSKDPEESRNADFLVGSLDKTAIEKARA